MNILTAFRVWYSDWKRNKVKHDYYKAQKNRISRGEALSISEVIEVLSQDGGPLEVGDVSIPGDDGIREQELKARVQGEINRHRRDES